MDTEQRIAAATELGWYNITVGPRALGTIPGPAGFPPSGTIARTLPSLKVLQEQLAKRPKR